MANRSRKAKKQVQRSPKRGPGVAQLEKMLHDEQELERNGIGGISSSFSSLVPSLPVTGNGNGSSQLGCRNVGANGPSKGVYIGGSGVFLPERTLLPISWGLSSGTTRKPGQAPKMATGLSFPMLATNGPAPPPPPPSLLQKKHHPMMDLFPLSPTTTTPPSSAGVYEPPSSQNPSHHNFISTLFPEEDKASACKFSPRPSFPMENRRPAPARMPFQPISNGVFNFGISRDPMLVPTSPLEPKVRTCASRPTTIQNCQPDLSKFNKNSLSQENTETLLLQRSSASESDVPVYKKGFFSFLLQPEDLQRESTSAEPSLCLRTETCAEKTGEFIDLDLKL
ncbi:hypothetical protein V6N11_048483 [Hibiscus sabdariffa]|uniref:Uncharacterized protein n=2 Tax=Hibiscus sabdariffa TaxID=183260 RepID=A0ABR2PVY9_9ROSI